MELIKLVHASIFIISFILLLKNILMIIMSTRKSSRSRNSSNYGVAGSKLVPLPPGPRPLPIIGNLHQLIWSSVLPHRRLMELSKKHGPLMHLKLGEVSAIVVSSREAAREMMKTNDISICDRPVTPSTEVFAYGGQGILLSRYGDYWRQIRKICVLELLSQKRVQSFRSIREEEVTKLIQSIYSEIKSSSNSPVVLINISQKISALTNDITTRAVMGNQLKEQEFFLMALNEAVVATAGFSLPDFFPSMKLLLRHLNGLNRRLRKNQRELDRLFLSILREHEQRKMEQAAADSTAGSDATEGLLEILLRIKDDAGLELPITLEGVKCVLYDIFGAGSETSTKTVEWAMAEMMKNPEVMNKAQTEVREVLQGKTTSSSWVTEEDISGLKYLKLVIKETLRMHAPVPLLLPRESREPFEMMGYHVPARATILVNAWAIARDPQYWDDPLVFKPERFEGSSSISFNGSCFEYIPFGAGRRVCPGIWFGLANIELPLAQLLYYFDWKLPGGMEPQDLDMSESFGVTIGRKASLLLHPTPTRII